MKKEKRSRHDKHHHHQQQEQEDLTDTLTQTQSEEHVETESLAVLPQQPKLPVSLLLTALLQGGPEKKLHIV